MGIFFVKHKIEELELKLNRDDLLRRSRILIVDDEKPDLIEDLQKARFAVDYRADITPENLHELERSEYDLVILDFGNVGSKMGSQQGLELMKHIKRVRPSVVVLAYTSKALDAEHAEFFRLADGVLSKDAGIVDSTDKIEAALRKAHSIENLWKGMLASANVSQGSKEDLNWQDLYVRGLTKPAKHEKLRSIFESEIGKDASKKAASLLLTKLFELGVHTIKSSS